MWTSCSTTITCNGYPSLYLSFRGGTFKVFPPCTHCPISSYRPASHEPQRWLPVTSRDRYVGMGQAFMIFYCITSPDSFKGVSYTYDTSHPFSHNTHSLVIISLTLVIWWPRKQLFNFIWTRSCASRTCQSRICRVCPWYSLVQRAILVTIGGSVLKKVTSITYFLLFLIFLSCPLLTAVNRCVYLFLF